MWRRRLCQPNDLGHPLWRNRRLAGRTGLVVQQTVHAIAHEPFLPAPDAGFGLAGPGHDGGRPEPLATEKDDPCPPNMFLRALGIRDDRLQSLTIAGRYREGNAAAHALDSHEAAQKRIPNRTLLIQSIH
jgi:hypothetical protein